MYIQFPGFWTDFNFFVLKGTAEYFISKDMK